MQSVSSNAVATTLQGYATNSKISDMAEYKYYDANTDRTVQANRSNAILHCLRNLKSNMFTIRYSGGYYYLYIANPQGSSEKTILEINSYSSGSGAFVGVWNANLQLTSCNLVKTL